MARRHHYKRRTKGPAHEIDVTTFLNLMVVLVPFLLITAVFSRLTIVELNLPSSAAGSHSDKRRGQLPGRGDRARGRYRGDQRHRDHRDYSQHAIGRTAKMSSISKPCRTTWSPSSGNTRSHDSASVLMEAQIPYDYLIQTMDIVRSVEVPIEDAD